MVLTYVRNENERGEFMAIGGWHGRVGVPVKKLRWRQAGGERDIEEEEENDGELFWPTLCK